MAHVIAFINEKGGVGKSSVCFNTAWCLAEQGSKVLLIDLDGQRANLTYICGMEKNPGTLTMYDVLTSGVNVKRSVLVAAEDIPLHIIPATVEVVSLNETNSSLEDMRKAVGVLRPYYDFIFIDVSPTPNRGHALALAAADGIIIPMLPDITSLEANMGVAESILLAKKKVNPTLKVMGVVLNKCDLRSRLSQAVSNKAGRMAAELDSKVFKTKIRQAVAMSENVGQHIGITEYDPKGKCAADIRKLCEEIKEAVEYGKEG